MSFSSYAILPFLASIQFLLLGALVFIRNKHSALNRSFAYWCLTTFAWHFSWSILFNIRDPRWAQIIAKIGYTAILYLPATFYHFTLSNMVGAEEKKFTRFCYGMTTAFLILLWSTDLVIDGVREFPWGYYPRANPILHLPYLIFLTYVAVRGLSILRSVQFEDHLDFNRKNQAKYVFWSVFIYLIACIDFPVNYGFKYYPFGVVFCLISLTTIGISILKHRLLDIELFARDTLAYGGAMGYLMAPFILVSIFWHGRAASPILLIGATVWCTAFYRHLLPHAERFVDETIFRGRFSARRAILEARNQSSRLSNLKDLVDASVAHVRAVFKVERVALYFHNLTTNQYLCIARFPEDTLESPIFAENDALLMQLTGGRAIRGSLPDGFGTALPLRQEAGLFGFMLISESLVSGSDLEHERAALERTLTYAYVFYEQSMMLDKMTHDNIRYADNIRRFLSLFRMDNLDDKQKSYLKTIDKQAGLILEYLNDLRQTMAILARRMQGKYEMADYDLSELIAQILPAESARAEQKGVHLACHAPAGLKGWGEPSSIRHIMENLLSNAFKFTPPGGAVTLEAKNLGRQIQIVVSDTGAGIPKASLSHIFDLFYQGEGREAMDKSTGLGLSIVKEIVALHKGSIDVISEVGKGTSFFVLLPTTNKQRAHAA